MDQLYIGTNVGCFVAIRTNSGELTQVYIVACDGSSINHKSKSMTYVKTKPNLCGVWKEDAIFLTRT